MDRMKAVGVGLVWNWVVCSEVSGSDDEKGWKGAREEVGTSRSLTTPRSKGANGYERSAEMVPQPPVLYAVMDGTIRFSCRTALLQEPTSSHRRGVLYCDFAMRTWAVASCQVVVVCDVSKSSSTHRGRQGEYIHHHHHHPHRIVVVTTASEYKGTG